MTQKSVEERPLRQTLRQGVAYLAVGGGTALLELGLFQLLLMCGAPVVVANVAATVIATATNFLLNRGVTFKSTANPARSALLYIGLFVFNTAVSSAAITFAVGLGVMPALAKVCMQVLVTCWNFVLYRKVVFA